MTIDAAFEFVCEACGSMAIQGFDAERASPSTMIVCAKCGHPRGTLATLQKLAYVGSPGQFDI
jgi:DNA-directed RNA polymerase subunit RPC12/RpoP